MCLSTVYSKRIDPETVIMKNVQTIECDGKEITLTDLMDRQVKVQGILVKASLTEGTAVIEEC